MHRPTAEDLDFLLPGVLHQFGNLLLTIQGHASTLEPDCVERAKQAILGATDRAGRTLRLLHELGGDSASVPANACELLEQLVELVRVPVRELHHSIRSKDIAARRPTLVQAGPFTRRFLAALRLLLAHLPQGQHGTINVDLSAAESLATVRLRFEPQAGALPFPIATRELLTALERAVPGHEAWTKCPSQGACIELAFPLGAVSHEAEA
ncbi:MAG: hypothetical protein ABIP94_09980 [Planctomycetota bacterium]